MSKVKQERLVRYVSPYGSPAWMPLELARKHLAVDDRRWLRDQELGIISDAQRQVGMPRIEHLHG